MDGVKMRDTQATTAGKSKASTSTAISGAFRDVETTND
jgi:hypothetical protein